MSEQLDRIEADIKEIKAKLEGFGPTGATGGDGSDPYSQEPGEFATGVKADGTTPLEWNEQAGSGARQVFQGNVSIPLVPTPGFTGYREISLSQVQPQFQTCSAKLDSDDTEHSGTNTGGTFKVYFADGKARTLHLKPTPARGAGLVQFVGGIPK